MSEHRSIIEISLSQHNVELLSALWYDSEEIRDVDKIRETIKSHIPKLRKYYNIPSDDTSFKQFIIDYDEMMYTSQCNKSPNECLKFFARKGDIKNVKIAISKGADNWNDGMIGAAIGGYLDLIEYFIELGANNLNWAMRLAAKHGHLKIVKHLAENGADNWEIVLYTVVRCGYLGTVKYLIPKNNTCDDGVCGAAQGGHLNIVKYLVELELESDVNIWNQRMYCAAR